MSTTGEGLSKLLGLWALLSYPNRTGAIVWGIAVGRQVHSEKGPRVRGRRHGRAQWVSKPQDLTQF